MHCPACGYDLRGLDGRRCPECGTIPALHGPRPIPRRLAEPAIRRLRATAYLAGFALLFWTPARDDRDVLAGLAVWQVILAALIVWRTWPDVRRHRRRRRAETRAYLRAVAGVVVAALAPLPVAWLAPSAWHGAIGLVAAGTIGVAGALRYAVAAGMAADLLRRRGRGSWVVTARAVAGTAGVLLVYAALAANSARSPIDSPSLLAFGGIALLVGVALASSATREIERRLRGSVPRVPT